MGSCALPSLTIPLLTYKIPNQIILKVNIKKFFQKKSSFFSFLIRSRPSRLPRFQLALSLASSIITPITFISSFNSFINLHLDLPSDLLPGNSICSILLLHSPLFFSVHGQTVSILIASAYHAIVSYTLSHELSYS